MICVADHYDCELVSDLTVKLPYIESGAVKKLIKIKQI